jgi:flagellar hook-associated protein 2
MTIAPVNFGGLSSGLNTTAIIAAEMAVYKQPLTDLQTQQNTLNTQIADYQVLNSQLLTLQQSAAVLATPAAYSQAFSASSSASSVATGTITSGTSAGAITLAVDQLATGSTQISSGTVASTIDVVASGNLLIGSGGAALGLSSISAGSGLAMGNHAISVTQASAGAGVSGGTSLAGTTSITGVNNQINVVIDANPVTITIPNGTYTPSQLAQGIALASSGALNASVNSNGQLSITTTQQGSAASLQITGGSALASTGLSAGSSVSGTDGQINVDGTTTTVNNIAGSGTTQVTLASGTGGTITAAISGGLSVASMTANNVSVGDGSLSSVISAINGANAGVVATALQVGANQYALEVTSKSTGTAGAATIDTQAFAGSSLGTLQMTTAAQNAIVSVGGVGGYQVTSATNAVSGLLPGVTVNLAQVSTTPVTLTIAPDGSQLVSQVTALVNAADQLLSTVATDTAYNQSTKVAGPLNGATPLTALAQRVLSIVGGVIGSSAAGSDGTAGESAGLSLSSAGGINFNPTAFQTAYNANPTAVQAMFTEGGTFSPSSPAVPGQVSVAGATNNTAPGPYSLVISQSAAQAVDTGSVSFAAPSATLASAQSYTVTSGSASATYAATAGESIANVVSGINAALAAGGIRTSASLVGSAGSYNVRLSSADYGSAATFSVSASGGDQFGLTTSGTSYAGTDVVGTINGQVATGTGQILSLAHAGNGADGLVLQVTTPGITSATSLGTVNYAPGFAQGLANLAEQATITPYGQIPNTINGLNNTLASVTSQIAMEQQLVNTQQASLTQEFTQMEMTLSQLNSQSSFLSAMGSAGSTSASGTLGSSSSSSSAASSLSKATVTTTPGG